MKKPLLKQLLLFSGILCTRLCLCQWISAEAIRGPVTEVITVKAEEDFVSQVSLTAGEILAVFLDNQAELLTGLEVEIIIADKLKQYADNFAIEIYAEIEPEPRENMFSFNGRKLFFEILPYLNTITVLLPFSAAENIRQAPGYYVPEKQVTLAELPLLLTVQTILKGIPDSVLLKNFIIKLKPRLASKGYLDLVVKKPDHIALENVKIFIDDIQYRIGDSALVLDAGIHILTVTAQDCLDENSSFLIEIGKTARMEVELKEADSRIQLDILPGTQVFIDGVKLDSLAEGGFSLPEGNHTFRFKIGDYSVSKSIYIMTGKKYNISLLFSVDVKEN